MKETRQKTSCNTNAGKDIRVETEEEGWKKCGFGEMNRFCFVRAFCGRMRVFFRPNRMENEGGKKIAISTKQILEKSEQNHVIKKCNSINTDHFHTLEETASLCFTWNGCVFVMDRSFNYRIELLREHLKRTSIRSSA